MRLEPAFKCGLLSRTVRSFFLAAAIALTAEASIVLAGLPPKWLFVPAAAGCFCLLLAAVGSLRKALMAFLIFSLSMDLGVSIGYSDRYVPLRTGIPIPMTSLLLLAIYGHHLCTSSWHRRSIRLFPQVTLPLALLVLWSGISLAVADQVSGVLSHFPYAFEALCIFVYAVNFVRSDDDMQFVIRCIAITVTVTGVLGILQYVAPNANLQFRGARDLQFVQEYYATTISRVSGFLDHPNSLAVFLSAWLPVLLVFGLGIDRLRFQLLCLLSFALGSVVLVLTYSRVGWVAFAFSLLLIVAFVVTRDFREQFRQMTLRLVAFLLTATVLTIPLIPNIVTRVSDDDSGSAYSRITMAQSALKIIERNWATGVGLGNYENAIWAYDTSPPLLPNGIPYPVHNMYLYMAAELGLPALILFLWITVSLFSAGVHVVRAANHTIALSALGLSVGLASMHLCGMVGVITLGHVSFVPLMFVGGLLVSLRYRAKEPVDPFLREKDTTPTSVAAQLGRAS